MDDDANIIQQNKRKSDNDTQNPGKRMKNLPSAEDDPCEGEENHLDFDLDAMTDKDDGTIPLDVLWKKLKEVHGHFYMKLFYMYIRCVRTSLTKSRIYYLKVFDIFNLANEVGNKSRVPLGPLIDKRSN